MAGPRFPILGNVFEAVGKCVLFREGVPGLTRTAAGSRQSSTKLAISEISNWPPTNIYHSAHLFAAQFLAVLAGRSATKETLPDGHTFLYFIAPSLKLPMFAHRVRIVWMTYASRKRRTVGSRRRRQINIFIWSFCLVFGFRFVRFCCCCCYFFAVCQKWHFTLCRSLCSVANRIDASGHLYSSQSVCDGDTMLTASTISHLFMPSLVHAANGSRMPIKIYRSDFLFSSASSTFCCAVVRNHYYQSHHLARALARAVYWETREL